MTPARHAHGTRPRKPSEKRREQHLHAWLGEDAPWEYDQYPCHELQQRKQHQVGIALEESNDFPGVTEVNRSIFSADTCFKHQKPKLMLVA